MTKAAEMAKTTTKSSFHILWGLVASTVISAIGTVYIANLLSSDGMGLYSLALAAPTLIARKCPSQPLANNCSKKIANTEIKDNIRRLLECGLPA